MTALSTLSVPVSERDVRMLTTLLASCDPCHRMDGDRSPAVYIDTACEILLALQAGCGETDVMLTMPDAEVEAAHRFAQVAMHWWENRVVAQQRRDVPLR